jgi:uncharacterized membrane protein YphA (DoxX/SURF4 family)
MKNSKVEYWIVEIISALLILLFVYAATSKLLDYQKFQVQLSQSPMLTAFSRWIALIIPAVEILIAAMLAIPRFRLIGLYASFSLLVMFTGYIIAITKFSDYVPCSCGGILENMGWNAHLIFNIFFAILDLAGIIIYSKSIEPKKFLLQ